MENMIWIYVDKKHAKEAKDIVKSFLAEEGDNDEG